MVAESWRRALVGLGWSTVTVAGDGPVDRLIPGLAIPGTDRPTAAADRDDDPGRDAAGVERLRLEVAAALSDVDLVVVENLLSIPMNLTASRAVARAVAGRPAIIHHHDPPWQRERYAHITELPPDDPAWRHVTINRLTQQQFEDRGLRATTIYNGFDPDPPAGDRDRTRAAIDVDDDQWLFVHPVRAIARKNIPAAVRLCEQLGAVYWLPGDAEEGYHDTLDRILASARCPVIRTPLHDGGATIPDLYAAADLVLFPSTWEGFGNPPIEAALHRRPVVVGSYPVARELRDMGFRWPTHDDPEAVRHLVERWTGRRPDGSGADGGPSAADLVAHNRALARTRLSTATMTSELSRVLDDLG